MPRSPLASVFQRYKLWEIGIVILIFVGALFVRLYKVSTPLGDWHSFRQSDTAAVTREFVRHGIDVLHPHYHDVSNIQSGELNLEGWRMVEFPLLNGLTAFLLRAWPQLDLVVTSRLVSVTASLVSLGALMYLAYRLWGAKVASVAGLVFAFLPYSVYYSRVILPEPFMVMWALLAAVAIEQWASTFSYRKTWFGVTELWLLSAGVFFALALLVKPVALFFIPFYIGVFWHYRPASVIPWLQAAGIVLLAGIPLWWWREWIQQFPSGIPASDWLLNGNGIRLKPAWWRWLFADRIGRLMFGYWGASILGFGLVAGVPAVKKWQQLRSWWKWLDSWLQAEGAVIFGFLGMLAYLVIFATGNVQHDYYQIPLVPLLALLWGRGAVWVWEMGVSRAQQIGITVVLIGVSVFSLAFAWYEVEGWYHINNPAYVSAGAAVRRFVPEDALIIAPGFGDTTFLFQTERWGWPIGFEIEDKIADGAQYYVSTAYDDEARRLEQEYTVLEKTDEYILIDLQQPNLTPTDE